MDYIQWIATGLSIAGNGFLALNNKHSRNGWILFLIANVFWIIVAVSTQMWGLLAQNIAFTCFSLLGLYNTFFRKG